MPGGDHSENKKQKLFLAGTLMLRWDLPAAKEGGGMIIIKKPNIQLRHLV